MQKLRQCCLALAFDLLPLLFGTLGQRCLSLSLDLGAMSIAEHRPSRSRAPTDHTCTHRSRAPTHESIYEAYVLKIVLKIRLVKKVWGEGGNLTSKVRFFSQA